MCRVPSKAYAGSEKEETHQLAVVYKETDQAVPSLVVQGLRKNVIEFIEL